MKRAAILCGLLLLLAVSITRSVIAHGGGTDAYSCHTDGRAGYYHCHSGSLAGRSFASRAEMLKVLAGAEAIPAAAPNERASTVVRIRPSPYDRSLYGNWIDEDGDCQSTREEVLIAESLIPAALDTRGCTVVAGLWFDPYIGQMFTNAKDLEVDHFIPLAEVHRSGGYAWTPEQRQQYANDLSDSATLIAVSAVSNRSKGDSGPDKWMPINKEFRCVYVATWTQVKRRWNLEMSESEQAAIRDVIESCRR